MKGKQMNLITIIAGAVMGILLLGMIGLVDLNIQHYVTGSVILAFYLFALFIKYRFIDKK